MDGSDPNIMQHLSIVWSDVGQCDGRRCIYLQKRIITYGWFSLGNGTIQSWANIRRFAVSHKKARGFARTAGQNRASMQNSEIFGNYFVADCLLITNTPHRGNFEFD